MKTITLAAVVLCVGLLAAAAFGQSKAPDLNDASGVALNTNQTITGQKNFTSVGTFDAGVVVFGKFGNSTTDGTLVIVGPAGTENAIVVPDGARIRWAGNNFLQSNGSAIVTSQNFQSSGNIFTSSGTINGPLLLFTASTLGTCNAGAEGTLRWDTLSGVATGKVTKLCYCVSSGASVYTWRNVLTNTNGTSTTCGTE